MMGFSFRQNRPAKCLPTTKCLITLLKPPSVELFGWLLALCSKVSALLDFPLFFMLFISVLFKNILCFTDTSSGLCNSAHTHTRVESCCDCFEFYSKSVSISLRWFICDANISFLNYLAKFYVHYSRTVTLRTLLLVCSWRGTLKVCIFLLSFVLQTDHEFILLFVH